MNRKDRTVYIMLTDYPDKVSRTIKRIGLWEYSHMSISTDEHYPKFFSFTGKRGFMTEDFDLHPTYKGTDVPCALFALPVTEAELRNVERIIKHMTSNADEYKYSYIGLALLYLRIYFAGIIFVFISILIGFYVLYSLIAGTAEHGWASLMLSIWFVGGVVLLSIGAVGLYIGKIYKEVKRRPLYNVEEVLYDDQNK